VKRNDIVIVTPNTGLADLCERVCRELALEIAIFTADHETGIERARQAVEKGAQVVISRGGTSLAIQQALPQVPVVEIRVTALELLRAIRQARRLSERIVAIGFPQFTDGFHEWDDMLPVSPLVLTLDSCFGADDEAQVISLLRDAQAKGYDFVVGDTVSTRVAATLGLRSILVQSGPEAVAQAITEAQHIATLRTAERDRTLHVRCIADNAYEGIISIDGEGIVRIFNPSAERILGIPAWRVVGRKLDDALEGFQVPAEAGQEEPEAGKILAVRGKTIAAHVVAVKGSGPSPHTIITFQEAAAILKTEHEIRRNLHARGLVADFTFNDIVGESSAIKGAVQESWDYARSESAVCIFGETGAGKELFAQAIHNASRRRGRPFVAFNCAAFPETLQESELFGYAEGAFTGAKKGGKPGLFEQAHGGSIFLDEIDALSAGTQALLLRVLQDQRIRRIGDDKLIPVDVRLITATNEDLETLLAEKRFRKDLYYRISVLNLRVPPLRDRLEDVPLLVQHFFKAFSRTAGAEQMRITPDGVAKLQEYGWPGNVRQLRNIVERLAAKTKTSQISAPHVLEAMAGEPRSPAACRSGSLPIVEEGTPPPFFIHQNTRIDEIEKIFIDRTVAACDGKRAQAAERLGISRTTLWRRMRERA
jgi:transcriptional regulator, propionate catabolism operon regulatory protein